MPANLGFFYKDFKYIQGLQDMIKVKITFSFKSFWNKIQEKILFGLAFQGKFNGKIRWTIKFDSVYCEQVG